MDKNSILEQELKRDRIVDSELDDAVLYRFIGNLMDNIENIRKKLFKISPIYTQAYLAERADISLSTYKNYLSGCSCNISLVTLLKIVYVLRCDLSGLLQAANTGDDRKKLLWL